MRKLEDSVAETAEQSSEKNWGLEADHETRLVASEFFPTPLCSQKKTRQYRALNTSVRLCRKRFLVQLPSLFQLVGSPLVVLAQLGNVAVNLRFCITAGLCSL